MWWSAAPALYWPDHVVKQRLPARLPFPCPDTEDQMNEITAISSPFVSLLPSFQFALCLLSNIRSSSHSKGRSLINRIEIGWIGIRHRFRAWWIWLVRAEITYIEPPNWTSRWKLLIVQSILGEAGTRSGEMEIPYDMSDKSHYTPLLSGTRPTIRQEIGCFFGAAISFSNGHFFSTALVR